MSDYQSLSKASFDAGRLAGHLEALRVMVAIMERSSPVAKEALMDACEHVSLLKERACNESI